MANNIQYGDSNGTRFLGTIAHHVSGPPLARLPTNPTHSTGHYYFNDDENGLQIANFSGLNDGEISLWNGSESNSPIKMLSVQKDGISCKKITLTDGSNSAVLSSTELSFNGIPIGITGPTGATGSTGSTGPPGNPANASLWSSFPAIQTVEVSSNDININGTIVSSKMRLDFDDTNPYFFQESDSTIIYILDGNILCTNIDETIQTVKLDATHGTLTMNDGTNTSVLSKTDLTFNGVSPLQELKIKQTNTILQNISPAIYADGRPPTAPTTAFINSHAYTPSWYFKNTVAGYKINWYAGPYTGMTVADLLGLYMYMFNGLTTLNDNTPFLTVYTQPQAGDPTFYHSKRTYIFDQAVTPVANTRYCMFSNISGDCPTPAYYGQTLNLMDLSPVAGSNVGPFEPTELILFFSIGSNSASTVNSVEFAVSKLGIMTPTGTQEFAYIPN